MPAHTELVGRDVILICPCCAGKRGTVLDASPRAIRVKLRDGLEQWVDNYHFAPVAHVMNRVDSGDQQKPSAFGLESKQF